MEEVQIQHYPNLGTVLMVERVLRNARGSIMTIPQIKAALPKQVNHATLKVILMYLEESGKIVVTLKGITWIHNTNSKLRNALKNGLEL